MAGSDDDRYLVQSLVRVAQNTERLRPGPAALGKRFLPLAAGVLLLIASCAGPPATTPTPTVDVSISFTAKTKGYWLAGPTTFPKAQTLCPEELEYVASNVPGDEILIKDAQGETVALQPLTGLLAEVHEVPGGGMWGICEWKAIVYDVPLSSQFYEIVSGHYSGNFTQEELVKGIEVSLDE